MFGSYPPLSYLDEVRSHLLDLEPEELEELLDDLLLHMQEVKAETDDPLRTVLGDPAKFAAELRSSAGLNAATADTKVERMVSRARSSLQTVESHPWVKATVEFLPELRPAWWVARGYLFTLLFSNGSLFPPHILGSGLIGQLEATVAQAGYSTFLPHRNNPPKIAKNVWEIYESNGQALVELPALFQLAER